MPIDYKKYPKDWKERRERILKRAKNKCEFCGLKNYIKGYRFPDGSFLTKEQAKRKYMYEVDIFADGGREIKIILTIAHLDHDEENHEVKDERLKALCQRCHLTYDVEEKKRRLKSHKAVEDLFAC